MKKTAVLICAAALVCAPFACFASPDYGENYCTTGKMDAPKEINSVLWFVGGMFGIGVVLGFLTDPEIPPSRLAGKSSDAVKNYTECYNEAAKHSQGMTALSGLGATVAGGCVAAVIIIGSMKDSIGAGCGLF